MNPFLIFLLCAGSTGFIAYVLTQSKIFDVPRLWIINRRPRQWWLNLWTCPGCMAFWVGPFVAAAAYVSGGSGWFFWPAVVLSGAYLVVATS